MSNINQFTKFDSLTGTAEGRSLDIWTLRRRKRSSLSLGGGHAMNERTTAGRGRSVQGGEALESLILGRTLRSVPLSVLLLQYGSKEVTWVVRAKSKNSFHFKRVHSICFIRDNVKVCLATHNRRAILCIGLSLFLVICLAPSLIRLLFFKRFKRRCGVMEDSHFSVNFSVVFESVEWLQDGVVVVGTCKMD